MQPKTNVEPVQLILPVQPSSKIESEVAESDSTAEASRPVLCGKIRKTAGKTADKAETARVLPEILAEREHPVVALD